jgi:O-antigen ligase
MIAARPVWGWGTGQYVLRQSEFTGTGEPADGVRITGATFSEMAFNEYLQTAAELGLPGLGLYLLVLACFFSKACHAAGNLPPGIRRATLLGCMGGIAAQMTDALANASWRFSECSLLFWFMLGLGVAMLRMPYAARCEARGARREGETG